MGLFSSKSRNTTENTSNAQSISGQAGENFFAAGGDYSYQNTQLDFSDNSARNYDYSDNSSFNQDNSQDNSDRSTFNQDNSDNSQVFTDNSSVDNSQSFVDRSDNSQSFVDRSDNSQVFTDNSDNRVFSTMSDYGSIAASIDSVNRANAGIVDFALDANDGLVSLFESSLGKIESLAAGNRESSGTLFSESVNTIQSGFNNALDRIQQSNASAEERGLDTVIGLSQNVIYALAAVAGVGILAWGYTAK